MRDQSHKTFIGTMREAVTAWRKREGWSRETVVQAIVDAHESISGPNKTGIRFDPDTRDTYERMKVNADRVFRWLDDDSKDGNLLPANFIPTILAAMPIDVRMGCLNDLLRPLDVAVHSMESSSEAEIDVPANLCEMIKESSEAHQAFAEIMSNPSAEAIDRAHKEVSEAIETKTRVRRLLESCRTNLRKRLGVVMGKKS